MVTGSPVPDQWSRSEPKGSLPHLPPRKRPRLLLVGNFFPVAGCKSQYCFNLAERLGQRGFAVRTVSRWRSRPVRLLFMAMAPWRWRAGYDVAHVDVFSGPSFLWAEAAVGALRAAAKPFVLTLHGGALPDFARRHPRRVTRLLGKAAAVTAPSSYLAQTMRPYWPDILVIPNALDISRYPFRHRQGVHPRLVWLRAFHRIYAPDIAVQVLALLTKDYPAARLTMVGPDKDKTLPHCRALAKELNQEPFVTFVPGVPKEEVPKVLARDDIFLNTTTVDNTPVSVLEAMACGLCVVSTDAGGVRHLVRDGEEALLSPVGEAATMAAAVRRLLGDPLLAGRISSGARRKAEDHDWNVVLPMWEELFSRIAAGEGSRGRLPKGKPVKPPSGDRCPGWTITRRGADFQNPWD